MLVLAQMGLLDYGIEINVNTASGCMELSDAVATIVSLCPNAPLKNMLLQALHSQKRERNIQMRSRSIMYVYADGSM